MDTLTVYAPGDADMFDSYGLIACELLRHLTRLGVHVNLFALGNAKHPNQPPEVAAYAHRPHKPACGGIVLGYPTYMDKLPALVHHGPRVCITMFESTKLPPDWPPILNRCAAVIVPSLFCADVFHNNGVIAPLYVLPLGVGEIYRPQKRNKERPLTFLAILDRGMRKGAFRALEAFVQAFGDSPDHFLILKGRTPRGRTQAFDITNPNIQVIQRDYTVQELYELYLSADVLINANAGEGFGLIPREFSATGGISLATGWGGTADDIELWGWPLPYKQVAADWTGVARFAGLDLGQWAEPDVDLIADLLRRVSEERVAYQARAQRNAARVSELYTWRTFAQQVKSIWQEVTVGEPIRA